MKTSFTDPFVIFLRSDVVMASDFSFVLLLDSSASGSSHKASTLLLVTNEEDTFFFWEVEIVESKFVAAGNDENGEAPDGDAYADRRVVAYGRWIMLAVNTIIIKTNLIMILWGLS